MTFPIIRLIQSTIPDIGGKSLSLIKFYKTSTIHGLSHVYFRTIFKLFTCLCLGIPASLDCDAVDAKRSACLLSPTLTVMFFEFISGSVLYERFHDPQKVSTWLIYKFAKPLETATPCPYTDYVTLLSRRT